MKIPERLYDIKPNLAFVLLAPLFTLLFVVIYTPSFGLDPEAYARMTTAKGFCLPILCSIELGVLLISRSILCFALPRHRITEVEFLIWQAIEFLVAALFYDLFLSLHLHIDYFSLLPRIILVSFAIDIFPYTVYWIFMERVDRDNRIAEAYKLMNSMRKGDTNEGMMRFADDKGNVKLVVGADRLISIQSAGNYLTILYDDDGRLARFSLHNTLKSIEKTCNESGIVRCHRSFLVNLNKVKVIRRTPEGLVAEIDHQGVHDIPVSKTYSSDLISLFSEI